MHLLPRGLRAAGDLAVFTPTPPPSWPSIGDTFPDSISAAIAQQRLSRITRELAMSIPAVRRGVHVIAGTISTFDLALWRDHSRLPVENTPAWVYQPDSERTLQWSLHKLIDDLIWTDRAYWRIERDVSGAPKYLRRIRPTRVTELHNPNDIDRLGGLLVDGVPPANLADILRFDGAGIGGLETVGADCLDLYMALQYAAGKYADSPMPKDILMNTGADLEEAEIEALLDVWEARRRTRSTGYMNTALEYKSVGWTAKELQLTEAREYAALETARILGLPAHAVNATTGDSMTYSTVAQERLDTLEALRPWMGIAENTMGMDDRTGTITGRLTPRGVAVKFDVDAYIRDDAPTRMGVWQQGLTMGIWTSDDIKRMEPLAWN